jgi:hypothetical protein
MFEHDLIRPSFEQGIEHGRDFLFGRAIVHGFQDRVHSTAGGGIDFHRLCLKSEREIAQHENKKK